ncbi:uncharacterized protein LOC122502080 isoform X2 [Leptopilina heterotoma]|nr:uncharacterized protein LOC122502080 isoform X2 [Leptopilina heterotoma]
MQYQSEYSHNHENYDSDSSNDDGDDSESSSNENSSSKSLSTTSSPISRKNQSPTVRKREFTKSPNASLKNNRSETSPRNSTRKKTSQIENDEKSESINTNLLIVLSLLAIVAVFFIFTLFVPNIFASTTSNTSTPNREIILKHVENEIRVLKKEFRNQEKKIWPEIYSGIIEVINNPTRPSIFVLFADRNDLMSCLALTIAEIGRMAFGTEESLKVKPTQLDNDTGDVITKLRSVIPQRKSVIFWDFLSINDKALNAFHFICDRENPLVQQAIYVITVKAEGYHESENPLRFIENKLRSNLTGRIKDDSLMPLITRITDGPIISVKPEFNMKCRYKNAFDY